MKSLTPDPSPIERGAIRNNDYLCETSFPPISAVKQFVYSWQLF
jgi:hypothetical protein